MTEEFSFPPWKLPGKRGGLNFTGSLKFGRSLSIKPRKQLEINMADKQLDACISEVVRKFQATENVQVQLKERQVTAVKSLLLPPFSLIRDFGKQNTHGKVSKISVSLTCYRYVRSKFTNHSPLA